MTTLREKIIGIAFISIATFGCTSTQQLTPEIIELASYKMPGKVCDDPVYTGCHEITTEQCKAELNQVNEPCIEATKSQIGDLNLASKDQYLEIYSHCVMSEHLKIRAKEGLTKCGKDVSANLDKH